MLFLVSSLETNAKDGALMPLSKTGQKIMSAMQKEYGPKKGKEVFFASENAGTIKGGCKDAVFSANNANEKWYRASQEQRLKWLHEAGVPRDMRHQISELHDMNDMPMSIFRSITKLLGAKPAKDEKGATMRRAIDSSLRARLHRALDRAIDRHRDKRAADSLRELAIARGQTEEAFGQDGTSEGAQKAWETRGRGGSGAVRTTKSRQEHQKSLTGAIKKNEKLLAMSNADLAKHISKELGSPITAGEARMTKSELRAENKEHREILRASQWNDTHPKSRR